MIKLLKYAILGLLMLDVAVTPSACRNNTEPSTHEGEVHFAFYQEINGEYTFIEETNFWMPVDDRTNFEIGDEITMEMIMRQLSQFELIPEDGTLTDYTIVIDKVFSWDQLLDKEITLPHILTDDDIAIYYWGIRNAFCFNVVIRFEPIVYAE